MPAIQSVVQSTIRGGGSRRFGYLAGARLLYYLDAGAGATHLAGSGADKLMDLSGNGLHTQAQGTDANRPTLSSTFGANNRMALAFNGTSQVLVENTETTNYPHTIVCVASTTSQANRALFDGVTHPLGTFSATRAFVYGDTASTVQMGVPSDATGSSYTLNTHVSKTWSATGNLIIAKFSGAAGTSQLNLDGVDGPLFGTVAPAYTPGLTVGALYQPALYWNGKIAFIARYPWILSAAEIAVFRAASQVWYGTP